MVAAIDKSKTPEINEIVAARAITPVMAWPAMSARALVGVPNVSGIHNMKSATSAMMM